MVGHHGLRSGKAARVFLKPLDTKQLGPDGSSVVPRRRRSTCPQPSQKPHAQRTLEAGPAPARKVIGLEKQHGLAAPSTRAWPPATQRPTLPPSFKSRLKPKRILCPWSSQAARSGRYPQQL